jgi:uncharacterized protein (TIGR02453 family)
MQFNGFTNATIDFLKNIAANNNRDWFEQNRKSYEEDFLEPMKLLVTDLGDTIKNIDPNIETAPAINKTISRIYRDIRFSRDKTPYRTDAWISFKRPKKVWGNVPEFFLYFTPEDYQFGMGFYCSIPENMEKFRYHIDQQPDRFKKIIDSYAVRADFELRGDEYKKTMPNNHSDDFAQWIQKKNMYLTCVNKIDGTFFSGKLKDKMESAYEFNAELYHFLMESINL